VILLVILFLYRFSILLCMVLTIQHSKTVQLPREQIEMTYKTIATKNPEQNKKLN